MGAIANVYNGIKSKLSTDVTSVYTFELFNSQYDNEPTERVTKYPAIFIEFTDINWLQSSHRAARNIKKTVDIGNLTHQQKGSMTICIHIAYKTLKNETDSFTEIDAIVTSVYQSLSNYEIEDCTGLQRVRDEQDPNHDGVVVWKTYFTTSVEDKAFHDTNIVEAITEHGGAIDLDLDIELDIDNNTIRTGDGQ